MINVLTTLAQTRPPPYQPTPRSPNIGDPMHPLNPLSPANPNGIYYNQPESGEVSGWPAVLLLGALSLGVVLFGLWVWRDTR